MFKNKKIKAEWWYGLTLFLLALLPLHAFLVTALNALFFDQTTSAPLVLKMWKEFLILVLAGGAFFKVWQNRFKIKLSWLDKTILIYFFWGLVSALLITQDLKIAIYGARYDFAFLIFYLILKQFNWSALQQPKTEKIIIICAGLVVGFALMQKIVLPDNFLVNFGYSSEHSHFSPNKPLAYCQKISGTENCRLQSFLAGPNQLGAYLLVVLPLFLITFLKKRQNWSKKLSALFFRKKELVFNWHNKIQILGFCLGILVLFLTYSRASWLGFMTMVLAGVIILIPNKKHLWWGLGGVILTGFLSVLVLLLIVPDFFHEVVFRPSSTQGHFERMADGVKFSLENPWGLGLGNAGPASNHFAKDYLGFIPESWYLQVSLELGLIGFLLYLSILILTLKDLLRVFRKGNSLALSLFLSLIGLMVATFFLHSWEDSTTALLFWGLVGIVLAQKE